VSIGSAPLVRWSAFARPAAMLCRDETSSSLLVGFLETSYLLNNHVVIYFGFNGHQEMKRCVNA
jgi:hypothetical protein